MRSIFSMSMASCPRPASRPAGPLQPDLFPPCVDCVSNSSVARIKLSSDGTRAICKGLHLHVGRPAEAGQRLVPDLANFVPAVAAGSFRSRVESEIGNAATLVRIHARPVLRKFGRLRRKTMLCRWVGHVTQAREAPLERRRTHDVLADQPVGLIDVLFGFPCRNIEPKQSDMLSLRPPASLV